MSRELLTDRLHVLLSDWPDAPLKSPSALIGSIKRMESATELHRLNDWIDRQQVCNVIIHHHGRDTLTLILKAIAEASARRHVAMCSRVQSVADFYEIGE